jgi:hypothetical protein
MQRMTNFASLSLVAACVFVSLPHHAGAQTSATNPLWSCDIYEESASGAWSASRNVQEVNGAVVPSRDTYVWVPKAKIDFGPGMTLSYDLTYHWPKDVRNQSAIALTDMMVKLRFAFEPQAGQQATREPKRSWLHFYRSSDPTRQQSFTAASLVNAMFWSNNWSGPQTAEATLTLDELLPFGTGYDSLVWNIRSSPDETGGSSVWAKGLFPISTLRDKAKDIMRLRRALNQKSARFKTQCSDSPPVAVVSSY